MRTRAVLLSLAFALAACGEGRRSFEQPLVLGGQRVSPDVLNRGEFVYMQRCRQCHGPRGRGDGPYASSLDPRPADLTRGEYPRIGATGGTLPSDEALARVIREGIEGTSMGPQHLEGENLEAVVQYLKTLSPAWRAQDVQ
ncbi:MAG TPA: cytochrome c [Sandaracinaceae bacterium]